MSSPIHNSRNTRAMSFKVPVERLLVDKEPVSGFVFQRRKRIREMSPPRSQKRVYKPLSPATPGSEYNMFVANSVRENFSVDSSVLLDSARDSQIPSPEPERYLVNEDLLSTVSTARVGPTTVLPPRHIDETEFHKCIPPDTTETFKMRQLLIWATQRKVDEDRLLQKTRDSKFKNVIKGFQEKLLTSSNCISSIQHPSSINQNLRLPNKRAVRILEETKKIEARTEVVLQEIAEWNKCTDEIYDLHAASTDSYMEKEANGFEIKYDESFMNDIEPFQQQFVKKFVALPILNSSKEYFTNLEQQFTMLKQNLKIADSFQKQVDEVLSQHSAAIAKKYSECTRLIPVKADKDLGLFVNTQEKKQKDFNDNITNMMRLISRKSTRRITAYNTPAEDDSLDDDMIEDSSDMEIDV